MEFAKAQIVANQKLPLTGTVFLSLNDFTKPSLLAIANGFIELGFTTIAITSTNNLLKMEGIQVERVLKLHEGCPHAGDIMENGQIPVNDTSQEFKKEMHEALRIHYEVQGCEEWDKL